MRTVHIKSAIPIYLAALVFIVFALIWPMYTMLRIIVCAAISIGVYIAASLIFKGRDVEVEVQPDTGDAELNRQISEGRRELRALKEANDGIPSPSISEKLNRMVDAGERIFEEIEKNTRKAIDVRKFMNYYLPTSVKLLSHYQTLMRVGGGENAGSSMASIESSLDMIATAFEKQLDNLYRSEALDISTDITVLETMMRSEGLAEDITGEKPDSIEMK